ncbi:cytochrome P450 9e2-like [Leptinotarsa decemlineata]|uniref:cytochrome P450 9e2 n=1 Tax=Leptinotarsa decemlineata TaxID=7539 RepID=UPI003D30D627
MGSRMTKPTGFNVIKGILAAFFPHVFEFFRIPIFPSFVTKFFQDLIKETISVREKNNIIRPDMIHLLMEARKGRLQHETISSFYQDTGFATVEESSLGKSGKKMELTDDLITAQALVFFFAGFDTSSTLLSFLSYHLAVDQKIQTTLQKEIDNVTKLGDGRVSYEELLKMKYLDQVISETLRRYPPGFMLTRICVKDYKIEAKRNDEVDFVLDKGTLVGIPVAGIHLDPRYFPDPEKFDPDRFGDENKANIIPGSFLPFGSGPRNCIGSRFALLECKTLVVSLLSKFDIIVIKKTPFPLLLSKTFNLAGREGIWLGLKKREKF